MKHYKNEFIQDKVISNKDFTDTIFENMVLEYNTFKDCIFKNTKFINNTMKHNKYINCKFIDADLAGIFIEKDGIINTTFRNRRLKKINLKEKVTWQRKIDKIETIKNISIF